MRQRKDWGTDYTNEDYAEFDRIFEVLVSDFGGEDAVSAKQQLILRNVARWMKQMNDMTAAGKFDAAKKLSGMIQENLASENLRKKDVRPADVVRLDEITDRLEKAGLLKNGKQCSPDEMFEYFFGRKPRYPYTADAVDQMILINENRMRQNDGKRLCWHLFFCAFLTWYADRSASWFYQKTSRRAPLHICPACSGRA